MGPAAAEARRQGRAHLGFGRPAVVFQERLGAHHHPGDAVAALRGLLLFEGRLDRAGALPRPQAFDRPDPAAGQGAERRQAGEGGLVVDQDRAGAALAEAAAELGRIEPEIVAQDVEQGGAGIDLQGLRCAVQGEAGAHDGFSLRAFPASLARSPGHGGSLA